MVAISCAGLNTLEKTELYNSQNMLHAVICASPIYLGFTIARAHLGKHIFWLSYQKHRTFKCKHNMVDTVVISCAKSFTHLLCFPKTSRHACFCHRYYTQRNYAFTLYGKFVHVYAYSHKKSSWAFPSCHSFFHFQQHCYKMQMNNTTITSCTLCSAICVPKWSLPISWP